MPKHVKRAFACSCEAESAPLRVAVLLSGGVDSSLALHLLSAAGHHVTAFYLQVWFQEDFRNTWDACPWEEDLRYCRAVCERLGVGLQQVTLTEQYWDRVVAHCIAEIQQGRTPNPDVLCNSRVKFGAFLEHLEARHGDAFDRIASGHYACLTRSTSAAAGIQLPQPQVQLRMTPDAVKDQTYFLAHLTQHQLARSLFPLGHLTKRQVRALAAEIGLPNQARKDSQGICFLGKVKFSEFVREHLGDWPGPLVNEDSNEVVGYHHGYWFHTVGQRKGIPLPGGPWYVTCKHPQTNTVYVSRQYHRHDKLRNSFSCSLFSWCSAVRPDASRPLYCKVRHGPHMYRCRLTFHNSGKAADVVLDGSDQGLAAGQYAVFYQDDVCLGSASITD
ncbi:hypothetical protein D9Q98_002638 [Chlorella vulgaris]|uniref:tRNA-5-taurinomethyluridine 2-sulfurtransferase n=1 Tax=Chlorella vulgaris TaxID=3077 RepID=A0A9D4TTW7_CHLVU|nr:hypothetical protein D9Q98_002638 [Chlorella vulgaris]